MQGLEPIVCLRQTEDIDADRYERPTVKLNKTPQLMCFCLDEDQDVMQLKMIFRCFFYGFNPVTRVHRSEVASVLEVKCLKCKSDPYQH